MKLILTILIIFLVISLNAQIDTANYNISRKDGSFIPYQIVFDNPQKLPDLTISTGLGVESRPLNNLDVKLIFETRYAFKNYGYTDIRLSMPSFGIFNNQYNSLNQNDLLVTTANFNLNHTIEGIIGVNLLDTSYFAHQTIHFNEEHTSNQHKIVKKSVAKYTSKHLIGARIGYIQGQDIVNSNLVEEFNSNFFSGFFEGNEIFHTNFSYHGISLGTDLRTFRNVHIKIDHDTILHSELYKFYFDVMYTPFFTLDDLLVRNFDSGEISNYESAPYFTTRNWGIRAGVEITKYVSLHNAITLQIETGVRPGIDNISGEKNLMGNKLFAAGRVLYSFGTKLAKK